VKLPNGQEGVLLDNASTRARRLEVCIWLLLVATLTINGLSAYIRHQEAGLGCADWPDCYGHIEAAELTSSSTDATVRALTPAQFVKQTHRAVATALVVLVVATVYLTRARGLAGTAKQLPLLMVAVVLALAVIGPASYLKTMPAVATANLIGGVALLTLAFWLLLAVRSSTALGVPGHWHWIALAAVSLQVTLGAWTSANFAGVACPGLWQCDTMAAGADVAQSFWYFRELALDHGGRILMDDSQRFIHIAHRAGAVVTALTVAGLGVAAWRCGGRAMRWGAVLLALLVSQVIIGTLGVVNGLPLALMLAHNVVASLLVLGVVRFSVPLPSAS